jgi:hypothetical protein
MMLTNLNQEGNVILQNNSKNSNLNSTASWREVLAAFPLVYSRSACFGMLEIANIKQQGKNKVLKHSKETQ